LSLCDRGVGHFVNESPALHLLDLQLGEGEHLLASATVAQDLGRKSVGLGVLRVLDGVVFAVELHTLVLLCLEVEFIPFGVGVFAGSVVFVFVDSWREGGFLVNGSSLRLDSAQSVLLLPELDLLALQHEVISKLGRVLGNISARLSS
jgi:hypothetical protein